MGSSLSFMRLLAGAVIGGGLAHAASRFGNAPDWLTGIHVPVPFLACFLGSVLGVRWAVGEGGTARWVALAVSILPWWLLGLAMFRVKPLYFKDADVQNAWDAMHLAALLGGWSVLVWRSMATLSGERPCFGALPLALAGLLVCRVISRLAIWIWLTVDDGVLGLFPDSLRDASSISASALMGTMALACGLGSMASLRKDLDQPWAWATSMAVALQFGRELLLLAFERIGGRLSFGVEIGQILLLEIAWFAYWGRRLARQEETA